MKYIFILMILNGCMSVTPGPGLSEDKEDPGCYSKLGARHGYCDARHGKDLSK